MTMRNLQYVFAPSSVALIGASDRMDTVGGILASNLLGGGGAAAVYPVNPRHEQIQGCKAFADINSLPTGPDLAVIATPPETVPRLIDELGERQCKAAVVISAGFSEGGERYGQELTQAMLSAAQPHLLRIVGPNCLGVMVPGRRLNASFIHLHPLPGNLAFVTQSGAVLASVVDWATAKGIGFSHCVSLGDMADVDFGDMLNYLSSDISTSAILLYIEAITHARKFMSAARAAARSKPVIVVKAGRYEEVAPAVVSHTGSLAGEDQAYEAAFRRAGMLRVKDMEALFDAVQTLSLLPQAVGDRLAILTNGGGLGIMAADTLIERQGRLAELTSSTVDRLNQVLPVTWSHGNPVDIVGDATAERYTYALEILLNDSATDAVLVINYPSAIASAVSAAQAVQTTLRDRISIYNRKPVLTCWMGNGEARDARQALMAARIPSYETPTQAVRGFMQLVRYRKSQEMLMETPSALAEDSIQDADDVRRIVACALAEGREWLTEQEAGAVLTAYAIPTVPVIVAATPEEAAKAAGFFGTAVALKVFSPDIIHKSEVQGVSLNLETPEVVHRNAIAMLKRVKGMRPDARLAGFIVQPMIRRSNVYELIVGLKEDPIFGPVLLFGEGGIAVEMIRDMALALPPLNLHLAQEVISRTRIHRLLQGYRGEPAADLDAIALTLVKVAQLVCDVGEIIEMDINPLLADAQGVLALDTRLRVRQAVGSARDRLAILPYPKELEEIITLSDGRRLLLRPVKPEDEPLYQTLFASLTPEEIRLRFLHPMNSLTHDQAARLTQIDYDRDMALVLIGPDASGVSTMYGVVGLSADPDRERAEFAILLHHDWTGLGLGPMLLRRIIDYARGQDMKELFGEVLDDNEPMIKLCRAFGFKITADREDPGVMYVALKL